MNDKGIFTIGHSTRSMSDFIDILKNYSIELLVDVRHFPKSRHNPQFNMELLKKSLNNENIEYRWLGEELGGFRKEGYKKFMCTKAFRKGIERLKKLAIKKRTAFMCAELLWFKCHRRYISDELKRDGWKVLHIYNKERVEKHLIKKRRRIKCDYP